MLPRLVRGFLFAKMRKLPLYTHCHRMLADVFTPVSIYLRLRDRFRDTVLLESTDHHSAQNSFSFIGINAIGGIEIREQGQIEWKYPGRDPRKIDLDKKSHVADLLQEYMNGYECNYSGQKEELFAQGLYGYTSYDAVRFFDSIDLDTTNKIKTDPTAAAIPLMRYRLYQYVIAIDHFRDELFICENHLEGVESDLGAVESLIRSKDVPIYPFELYGEEFSNLTDQEYIDIVKKGISSCHRGDVFQIVLSRRFQQGFRGDEFNVYRALRNVNPSPYLFFFDYGDYKLMGSSPEAQLLVANGKAIVHPIAGTFKRTGNDEADRLAAEKLLKDPKENAEHVMLVDLARNDLSRVCSDVTVTHYREVQYFSHVIHLVSEVMGKLPETYNPFSLLANSFPAGTLSGAPKFRAMQLIDALEPTARAYYGGAIGFVGFNGHFNHAILIRSFLSKQNLLTYQAGAGVVAASVPENELQEVNNKLGALKKALQLAEKI